jgi:hypothetical protein
VFPRDHGFKRLFKTVLGGRALNTYRLCRYLPGVEHVIWKDPFALFCSSTINASFFIPVVYTIRNPWAVAASFKRMGWGFDLDEIIKNSEQEFVPKTSSDSPPERSDSVKNAAWLWYIIHSYIYYQSTISSGQICLVNTDTIIKDPVSTYESVFGAVGLHYTKKNVKYIQKVYKPRSDKAHRLPHKAHDADRDLSMTNEYWRSMLTETEAQYISEVNELLWSKLLDVPGLI